MSWRGFDFVVEYTELFYCMCVILTLELEEILEQDQAIKIVGQLSQPHYRRKCIRSDNMTIGYNQGKILVWGI